MIAKVLNLLILVLFSGFICAQEPPISNSDFVRDASDKRQIIANIQALRAQIEDKSKTGDSDFKKHKQDLLRQEILLVQQEVAGFEGAALFPESIQQSSVSEDIAAILKPLFSSLHDMTDKPRQIAALKSQKDLLSDQAEIYQQGSEYLFELLNDPDISESDKVVVSMVQQYWHHKAKSTQEDASELETRYQELLTQGSVLDGVNQSVKDTLKQKLFSVFFAAIAALLTLGIFNFLASVPLKIESRTYNSSGKTAYRVLHFALKAIGAVGAFFAIMAVFYVRNDWLLLGITLIVAFVIAISVKDLLPQYLVEIRTLLNLGPVREGERIVYDGIPWKVKRLGLYVTLHNPTLDGLIRVPLSVLADCYSRPYHKEEPWFPCKVGDHLLLSDGAYGQVEFLSPEIVQLRALGALINYPTSGFYGLNPKNLSQEVFVVATTFGVDYSHQAVVTNSVLAMLKEHIYQQAKAEEWFDRLQEISVDFESAGASSLDLKVVGVFNGEAAESMYPLRRWLQRACVNACNEYNWGIPFQQITLHQA